MLERFLVPYLRSGCSHNEIKHYRTLRCQNSAHFKGCRERSSYHWVSTPFQCLFSLLGKSNLCNVFQSPALERNTLTSSDLPLSLYYRGV